MTETELKKQYLETEHGTFTPNYTYNNYDAETETYTGLIFIKTAQEVYNEWLENKDKPIEPQPSTDDKIIVLENENAELKARVDATENALLELMMKTNTI